MDTFEQIYGVPPPDVIPRVHREPPEFTSMEAESCVRCRKPTRTWLTPHVPLCEECSVELYAPIQPSTVYHVNIVLDTRWLCHDGGTTPVASNRGYWPTPEKAKDALVAWLAAHPNDPATPRLLRQLTIDI
jgi:hypothetical protein